MDESREVRRRVAERPAVRRARDRRAQSSFSPEERRGHRGQEEYNEIEDPEQRHRQEYPDQALPGFDRAQHRHAKEIRGASVTVRVLDFGDREESLCPKVQDGFHERRILRQDQRG